MDNELVAKLRPLYNAHPFPATDITPLCLDRLRQWVYADESLTGVTYRHVLPYLAGECDTLPASAEMDWFHTSEKAAQVKATGISALEYAKVLLETHNPAKAVDQVLGKYNAKRQAQPPSSVETKEEEKKTSAAASGSSPSGSSSLSWSTTSSAVETNKTTTDDFNAYLADPLDLVNAYYETKEQLDETKAELDKFKSIIRSPERLLSLQESYTYLKNARDELRAENYQLQQKASLTDVKKEESYKDLLQKGLDKCQRLTNELDNEKKKTVYAWKVFADFVETRSAPLKCVKCTTAKNLDRDQPICANCYSEIVLASIALK